MTLRIPFCFVLLISIYKVEGIEKVCQPTWVDCGNGNCVAPYWRCDGEDDCGNNKDEVDCTEENYPHTNCGEDKFSCSDLKMCIPMKWKCDGHKDCMDSSDEKNCGGDDTKRKVDSTCDGFRCKNGVCVPDRWRCDGMSDCRDGSDEENCVDKRADLCKVIGNFWCSSSKDCIPPEDICNGKKDCPNGEDEGDHCHATACANKTCAYKCDTIFNIPYCYCPHGFRLSRLDNRSCIDVDECKLEGYCSQMCENNNGSVKCSCIDGYELKQNRFCEAAGDEPLLLFSNTGQIRAMWLKSKQYFPVGKHATNAFGMDYDMMSNRVYWSGIDVGATIKSADMNFKEIQEVVSTGLSHPVDLAVDWLGRNLYITDDGLESLLVCKLDGSFCTTLVKNIEKPRSIALDPTTGIMYWTDWSENATIHKQDMDGGHLIPFVSNLGHPNGVALDKPLKVLYWADAKRSLIERINLDGTGRKVILKEKVFHPYSLTVFEDTLYWADWFKLTIDMCNKFTGKNFSTLTRNPWPIGGLHIYHPVLHEKYAHNPCWSSRCSHLCLIAPNGRYSCACPAGLHLNSDKHSCLPDKMVPRLYVIDKEGVYQIFPEAVGSNLPLAIPLLANTISDVAYDWERSVLFVADFVKSILTVNMTSFLVNQMVTTRIGRIDALCYDHIGENLYWADGVLSTIEVASVDGSHRTVLIENIKPSAMVLNPTKGEMYVALLPSSSHVDVCNMDGRNCRPVEGTGFTTSISFSSFTGELYWINLAKSKIMHSNINLGNTSSILDEITGIPTAVAVSEKYIYWTEMASHLVSYSMLSDLENVRTIKLPDDHNKEHIRVMRKLVYIHPTAAGRKVCKNSRCSHLCLVNPTGHICACSSGFKLAADNLNCIAKRTSTCGLFEFTCKTGECVSKKKQCDGIVDCKDKSDEDDCDLTCPVHDFRCANGRCISSTWRCDSVNDCGDNSDEADCTVSLRPTCSPESFTCNDGKCLSLQWVCDLANDCSSGEDEKNCEKHKCPQHYKRCYTGQCIQEEWWCDGAADCSDMSDEKNCTTPLAECEKGQFQCKLNGPCIDTSMLCDYIIDCPGGEDEVNCTQPKSVTCSPGSMRCEDGRCIHKNYICDGFKDCKGGEDEKNCPTKTCLGSEFTCPLGRCIPKGYLCDGWNDCGDNSDETLKECSKSRNKTTTTTSAPTCSASEFTCLYSISDAPQCISLTQVCDGIEDCLDRSDESSLCGQSCGRSNGGCSHICNTGPSGIYCSCFAGYILKDKVACIDVDECKVPGHCSHYCDNTKGSFVCRCEKGYSLTHDRRTCKAKGRAPVIIYSDGDEELRSTSLHYHDERVLVKEKDLNVTNLDYNKHTQSIIWADTKGFVKSYSTTSRLTTTIIKGLNRPLAIAYDWIAQNYYVTSNKGIHACSNSSNQMICATIIEVTNETVVSLALAPNEGLMFWSSVTAKNLTTKATIERSEMDGNMNRTLVGKHTYYPIGLSVDHVLKTLYWIEPLMTMIASINFEGGNRKIVLQNGLSRPFSLAVFEDNLFWSDWSNSQLMACDKFSGDIKPELTRKNFQKSKIRLIHSVLQPSGHNACLDKNCSHICLISQKGATCMCPDDYVSTPAGCRKASRARCTENYCQNNGKCVVEDYVKVCKCPSDYEGERCEKDMTASGINESKKSSTSVVVGIILTLLILSAIVGGFLYWRRNSKNDMTSIIVQLSDLFKRNGDRVILVETDDTGATDLRRQQACEAEIHSKFPEYKIGRSGKYVKWESVDDGDEKFEPASSKLDDSDERTDIGFQKL